MSQGATDQPAVWFPAIRAGSGKDIFTERLAAALEKRGIRSAWWPHVPSTRPRCFQDLSHRPEPL